MPATPPEAVAKDQNKTFLGNFISGSKFNEQPVDLSNLIQQGGYQLDTGQTQGVAGSGLIPSAQIDREQGLQPNMIPIPPQVNYGFLPQSDLRDPSQVPGTPPSQFPQFTPEGFKISAYNPSLNLGSNQNQQAQGQGGQGGGGGGSGGGTTNQGDLTYNVFGLPINYDYTGGPERRMIGGGFMRDGQYIGPFNFKNGGIANFRGYGY